MTNLTNSSKTSNDPEANARIAAQQVLAVYYPHVGSIFSDQQLITRLEHHIDKAGSDWIDFLYFKSKNTLDLKSYPDIKRSVSEGFFKKLNDILNDPKEYYDVLRDLLSGFDYSGYDAGEVNRILYTAEILRSFLLESYVNQLQQ